MEEEGILGGKKTKKEILDKRRKKFMEKPLDLQFMRKTVKVGSQETWNWLKRGLLKKETAGKLMTASDQALRTNSVESKIDKQSVSPLY